MLRKILKYLGLFLLILILIVGGIYLFVPVSIVQNPQWTNQQTVFDHFEPDSFSQADIAALAAEWGNKKVIPEEFYLQALLALRQYPELKDKKVVFHYIPTEIPLSSRPSIGSIFRSADYRQYNVIVSSESNPGLEPILIHSLPFDAQVAILAHELGHSLFYTKLSGVQIAKFGLMYALEAETRAIHEKGTDSLVVYRGLGRPLWEYAEHVRSPIRMGDGYVEDKAWVDQFYLKPQLILDIMDDLPGYE